MSRTIRIVNYSVNGGGVGHLTRLVAINRWVRRYARHAGVQPEIFFLSSSEADGLLFGEGFASFKLPSKTAIGAAGIDKLAWLALAKQWVWHSLGLLRPDLFVVDTFPRGSYGELLNALDLCRSKAFIFRPMKDGFASRADFQAMLPLYDLVLVPDDESAAPVQVPESVRSRLRHVGPVMVRERVEMLAREEARARLGIAPDRLAVYVSAGGGGDATAERHLLEVARVLGDDPSLHLVIGAGPIYRGRRVFGERVTWLTQGGVAELLPAFDVAICAAGYNTFFELQHAGVPAIFLPQEKVADEQDVRARRAAAVGAGLVLSDVAALRTTFDQLREPSARERAAQAARAFVPRNNARTAAAELLRLVLPTSAVDAAEEAVTDAMLSSAGSLNLPLERILELVDALDPHDAQRRDPEAGGRLAVELLRIGGDLGVPVPALVRMTQAVSRKVPRATVPERARAVRQVVEALVPFNDWNGAALFLKAFGVEKDLRADQFADELARFLTRLRNQGEDLYRGLARLSGAQGGDEQASNQDLLRAAAGEE